MRSGIIASHNDTVVIALPRPGGRRPRPAGTGTRAAMTMNHNETVIPAERSCSSANHNALTRRRNVIATNHSETLLAGTRSGMNMQHNETLLAGTRSGIDLANHNETLLAAEHSLRGQPQRDAARRHPQRRQHAAQRDRPSWSRAPRAGSTGPPSTSPPRAAALDGEPQRVPARRHAQRLDLAPRTSPYARGLNLGNHNETLLTAL